MPTKSNAFMQAFGYKDLDDGGDGLYIAPDLRDEYVAQTSLEMGRLNGGL